MLPVDGDYLVFLLVCATVGTICLLLLLQVYMLCFLKGAAPQGRHLSSPEADAAEAPAGGGVDASTWAALPGVSCGWAGDEEAGDCVVCLSALQGAEDSGGGGVRVLPRCRHAFHEWCIGRWLVAHSVCCPICRTPARPDQAAAPEVVVTSPPLLPPTPPPLPPLPPPGGGGVGGGMVGYFSRRGAMLLSEHQAMEELHLPLLLLY